MSPTRWIIILISILVAPICYVYSDPIHLYFIFRKLFMTYFYKLTIISCDPQSILGLCVLFENFLQCKDPKVFNHLRKLDVQPLSIVFKWLVRCYSGFLASSQVLELWDRILAFNSLEILSSLDFLTGFIWFQCWIILILFLSFCRWSVCLSKGKSFVSC